MEKSKIIDGSKIEEGNVVLGIASNGIHTNGYTLVRSVIKKYPKILDEEVGGETFIDAILKAHICTLAS